jgi:hypothetical protein
MGYRGSRRWGAALLLALLAGLILVSTSQGQGGTPNPDVAPAQYVSPPSPSTNLTLSNLAFLTLIGVLVVLLFGLLFAFLSFVRRH